METKINYNFSEKQKNERKNRVLTSKYHKCGMFFDYFLLISLNI